MKELFIELGMALLLSGGMVLLVYFKKVLPAIVNGFIQQAEDRVKKSKMGAEKKEWVIAQLNAAGIKVTAYVNALIEQLVKVMNDKK